MSARKLTDGHMAKVVRAARDPEVTDPKKLDRDQMRLYSFYKPSLQAGDYTIEATQTITSGNQSLKISNTTATDSKGSQAGQEFEVVVPRFSLDPNLINSYYPPDGHQDEGRILPHIVLNDPHYPWEIAAGITNNLATEIDASDVKDKSGKTRSIKRSMVPWVALLVFDPEELHISTVDEATRLNLPGIAVETDLKTQNANGTFTMPVSNYFNSIASSARINYAAGFTHDAEGLLEITDSSESAQFIFPRKDLIKSLFSCSDPEKQDTAKNKYGIEQYKYLAHVRHINTEGCPDAGVEEEGLFSIVLSSRTGALRDSIKKGDKWKNLSRPHTQVVHLVSIEHLDSTLDLWGIPTSDPPKSRTERVGLVSLFSWVYTALPPDPVNFIQTMRNLTENQQMLRADDKVLAQLEDAAAATSKDGSVKSQVSTLLAERLKMGYTLARWRTQTGEESTALNRGPLVPLNVPSPPAKLTIPDCSSTSQDYQILDPQTGLVDLSYSSAWQVGKLLAISDGVFSSALMRFRSVVRNSAADQTRMKLNNMTPGSELFKSVKETVDALHQQSNGQTGTAQRMRPAVDRPLITDLKDLKVLSVFKDNLKDAISSSTAAGTDPTSKLPIPYNGFNRNGPSNSDWPIIHDWLAEKLSLGGIPPQYLIPEPSFLPPESLRSFYIDDFWLDCLLDGALSVANHLDDDDDIVRRELKKMFNVYLDSVVPEAGFKPQVPCYGFIIRSKLIKAMPDMRITVQWQKSDHRFPVCRWTKWDEQTLMCLLDREPEELKSITLSQPQHQQRYAFGSHITADEGSESVTFPLRKLLNQAPGLGPGSKELPAVQTTAWLDFSNRRIRVQEMATGINQALRDWDPKTTPNYTDSMPNSCESGLVLNDPSYYFQIAPRPVYATNTIDNSEPTPRRRQLFVREPTPKPLPTNSNSPDNPRTVPTPPATVKPTPTIPTANSVPTPKSPNSQLRIQPLAPLDPTKRIAPPLPDGRSSTTSNLKVQFEMTIFPDYKGPPRRLKMPGHEIYDKDDFISTGNTYYFDLIFYLRKVNPRSDFNLLRITIDIPILTKATGRDAKSEPLLTDRYDGPGVRMLSNQRFIPFLFNGSRDDKVAMLHVELIPRSTQLDYALSLRDGKSKELGFRLAEPNIAPLNPSPRTAVEIDGKRGKEDLGRCKVVWTEWYKTSAFPDGEGVSGSYFVIKRAGKDPKEKDDA